MEDKMTTLELLDSQIRENLERISLMDQEDESDARKELIKETDILMKAQQEYKKIENDAIDKKERRDEEAKKSKRAHKVEIAKLELETTKVNNNNAFEASKLEVEHEDKKERRRIEEAKIQSGNEIEEKKIKFDWKDVGVKLCLCLIPLAIKIAVRAREQKMLYDFEEHGRLTSTSGKQYRPIDLNGKD